MLLISPYSLASESLAELKKRYPQDNIRFSIDGAGWLLETPNLSAGYRRGANYYGLMYQQNSFDKNSEKYTRKTLDLDFKRYFQNKPLTLRMTLHYLQVDA